MINTVEPSIPFSANTAPHSPSSTLKCEGWILWRLSGTDTMTLVKSQGVSDRVVHERSSELAEAAIRLCKPQTCVLTSPSKSMLVAYPTPRNSQDCICIQFPCEVGEVSTEAIAHRVAATKQIAEKCSSQVPATEKEPSSGTDLPSWKGLALLISRKVLELLSTTKARLRFLGACAIAIPSIGLIPFPHSVDCKVVCEPTTRRYVSAPFDSRLLESHVVIGQQVVAGELLATLDGSDLRSQLASVRAKLAQARQRELAALSTGDHSKAGLERLEVEHLNREAELLERRKSKLEIRSPIDGIVIVGDLERAEGIPLTIGDSLFEIASLDRLVAEVAIPEEDINYVQNGMAVSIVMDSAPDKSLDSKIRKIHLRNELRNNKSVFIAEVDLSNDDRDIRPGMNANASVDAGYRPAGWILFHRPYNTMRHWIGW